jgi:hypothetical protein
VSLRGVVAAVVGSLIVLAALWFWGRPGSILSSRPK